MGVKRIPSYLKGLAERYARTQTDIESLKVTAQIAKERAEYYKKLSVSSTASLQRAVLRLQSLEVLIRDYNESLDPSKINPVNAWRDRYGKKGALEKETFELVRLYGEEGVTSSALYEIFAKRLGLPLDGEQAEKHKANRFRCALKRLQRKGLIRHFTLEAENRWVALEHLWHFSDAQTLVRAQFQSQESQPCDAAHV